MIFAGIDEAGKGCVLGALVIGFVVIESETEKTFPTLGIKDSKLLSPTLRNELEKQIFNISIYATTVSIPANVVDQYCNKQLLNYLEAQVISSLVNSYTKQIDTLFIDALGKRGKNGTKFEKQLSIQNTNINLIIENKADIKYPVVSAASILAKVERDRQLTFLEQTWGKLGCGYSNDKDTLSFLKNIYHTKKSFPHFVRQSWTTISHITEGKQKDFFSTI